MLMVCSFSHSSQAWKGSAWTLEDENRILSDENQKWHSCEGHTWAQVLWWPHGPHTELSPWLPWQKRTKWRTCPKTEQWTWFCGSLNVLQDDWSKLVSFSASQIENTHVCNLFMSGSTHPQRKKLDTQRCFREYWTPCLFNYVLVLSTPPVSNSWKCLIEYIHWDLFWNVFFLQGSNFI